MTSAQIQPPAKQTRAFLPLCLAMALLFILFAIQIHSPLRLNPDAERLLDLSAKLTDGQPYLQNGLRPIYPIGIPFTFSLMERAGVANPVGFAVLNLLCLCVAATATWIICRNFNLSRQACACVILISFSSFVVFKHSVTPLTDIPYMAISLVAIALFETAPRLTLWKKIIAFLLALLFVIGGILTRRIGIALIPAFVYALLPPTPAMALFMKKIARRKEQLALYSVILLVCLACVAFFFRRLLYIPDFELGDSWIKAALTQVYFRLNDFGELILNAPVGKLGRFYFAVYPIGCLLPIVLCVSLWRARYELRPTHIYFVCYSAILLIWPFSDARFWLPLLPVITLLVFEFAARLLDLKWFRTTVSAYLFYYALLAVVSVAFTTRITFAGERFTTLFGGAETRMAYEQARNGNVSPENEMFVRALRRYGKGNP